MKTNNKTLIEALRILARDIQSSDGIANACIAEGADRIEEQDKEIKTLRRSIVDYWNYDEITDGWSK